MVVWSITLVLDATEPVVVLIAIHLLTFFWIALACHQALHDDRPAAGQLTWFYLVLAIGGLAGGTLSVLLAPLLFDGQPEYPLAMLAGCALTGAVRPLLPPSPGATDIGGRRRNSRLLIVLPLLAGGVALSIRLALEHSEYSADQALDSVAARYIRGAALTLPILGCLIASGRPLSFAAALAAVLAVSVSGSARHGDVLLQERTWFGVHRVTRDPITGAHLLVHGNTVHGYQRWSPQPSLIPGSYYHPDGPAGDIFELLDDASRPPNIAVVGLGAGSLAAFARQQPGQRWTFYEIDPAVARIARNPNCFTFLSGAFPDEERLRIVIGDGRLKLQQAPDGACDLIVLDAFSSDAIPAHLLTSEAVALYARKLSPDGVLALHISNRNLDLASLVAALAADQSPPLVARERMDGSALLTPQQRLEGKLPSHWVVLARTDAPIDELSSTWLPLRANPTISPWTDDYADLTSILKSPFEPID